MKLQNLAPISILFVSAYAVYNDPPSVQGSTSRSPQKIFYPKSINLKLVTYFECPDNQFYPATYIKSIMDKARFEFNECNTGCLSSYPMGLTTCPSIEKLFFSLSNPQRKIYYRYPIFLNGVVFENVKGAEAGSDFIIFNDQTDFAGVARKPPCQGHCRGTSKCVTIERKLAENLPLIICEPKMGELPRQILNAPQFRRPQFRQIEQGQSQFHQTQQGQPWQGQPQQGQPQQGQPWQGQPRQGQPQFYQPRAPFQRML